MPRKKNPNLVSICLVITKQQQEFLRAEVKNDTKTGITTNQSILLREALDDLIAKRKENN